MFFNHTMMTIKKNFNDFTIVVMWKKDEIVVNKISVTNVIRMRRINASVLTLVELPIIIELPA